MMDSKYREYLSVYLKGLGMGTADAIPGVSGGTIALITGIYQRLIHAISAIDVYTGLDLLKALGSGDKSNLKQQIDNIDGYFLVSLAAGIMTALFFVLNLMHYLLANFTVITYGFFFGLIAASAILLFSHAQLETHRSRIAALTGFLTAFLLSGYGAATLGNSLPVLFISGAVAVSAMLLPGISGSLILVIMGQYDFMTTALSDFTDAVLSIGDTGLEGVAESAPPIVVFVSGALVGVFSVANVVQKALDRYRKATMAFLVSMIVGALRAPVAEVNIYLAEQSITWITVLPSFVGSAIFGGLLVGAVSFFTSADPIS
jgi:putative membrane protein